jgi:hypothetical protein
VGTFTVAVLINMSNQPATPIVTAMLEAITTTVENVPTAVFNSNHIMIIMVKNIRGTIVVKSRSANEANE